MGIFCRIFIFLWGLSGGSLYQPQRLDLFRSRFDSLKSLILGLVIPKIQLLSLTQPHALISASQPHPLISASQPHALISSSQPHALILLFQQHSPSLIIFALQTCSPIHKLILKFSNLNFQIQSVWFIYTFVPSLSLLCIHSVLFMLFIVLLFAISGLSWNSGFLYLLFVLILLDIHVLFLVLVLLFSLFVFIILYLLFPFLMFPTVVSWLGLSL